MVSLITGPKLGGLLAGGLGAVAPPLTGLDARWRADTGVTEAGTGVSSWVDMIGSFDMVQGTDANRPALVTGVINGQPVIRFTRANTDFLTQATGPTGIAQPYAIVAVLAHTASSGVAQWLCSAAGGVSFRNIGFTNDDKPRMFAGASFNDDVALAANFHSFIGIFNGASSEIFIDNTSVVTGDNGGGSSETGFTVGGGNNSGADPFGGDLAEVLFYDHALDASERTALDSYVAARYGI